MTEKKNELVVKLNNEQAVAIFSDKEQFDDLLKNIREVTDNFVADVTTTVGRANIKSMAYKVTRTRTTLDALGKNLNAKKRAEIDSVDEVRRDMWSTLEKIGSTVRQPLTDWEDAEKERIDAIKVKLNEINQIVHTPYITSEELQERIDSLKALRKFDGFEEFEKDAHERIDREVDGMTRAQQVLKAQEETARQLAESQAREKAERLAREKAEAEAEAERKRTEQAEAETAAAEARAQRIHEAREREKARPPEPEPVAPQVQQVAESEVVIEDATITVEPLTGDDLRSVSQNLSERETHPVGQVVEHTSDEPGFNEAVSQLYHLFPSIGSPMAIGIIQAIVNGQIKHVNFSVQK